MSDARKLVVCLLKRVNGGVDGDGPVFLAGALLERTTRGAMTCLLKGWLEDVGCFGVQESHKRMTSWIDDGKGQLEACDTEDKRHKRRLIEGEKADGTRG